MATGKLLTEEQMGVVKNHLEETNEKELQQVLSTSNLLLPLTIFMTALSVLIPLLYSHFSFLLFVLIAFAFILIGVEIIVKARSSSLQRNRRRIPTTSVCNEHKQEFYQVLSANKRLTSTHYEIDPSIPTVIQVGEVRFCLYFK